MKNKKPEEMTEQEYQKWFEEQSKKSSLPKTNNSYIMSKIVHPIKFKFLPKIENRMNSQKRHQSTDIETSELKKRRQSNDKIENSDLKKRQRISTSSNEKSL